MTDNHIGAVLSMHRRYITRDRRIWSSQLVGYRTAANLATITI
jgi:hypothetical protein